MLPSRKSLLARMCACRLDLMDNGIDADALGPRAVCDLARRNLDYFQAVLGYDAGLREVIELIGSTRDGVGVRGANGMRAVARRPGPH